MIASMIVPKKHFMSSGAKTVLKCLAPENVCSFLDFSSRLLMPWAGIYVAREALVESKGAKFLLELASRKATLACTEEAEADWRDVFGSLPERIASLVEEAVLLPAFGLIDMKMLEDIVGCIKEGSWSEETLHVFPCDQNIENLNSRSNSQGFYLNTRKATKDGNTGAYIYRSRSALMSPWTQYTVVDCTVTARACQGGDLAYSLNTAAFAKGDALGWHGFLSQRDEERFRHNNAYELSFRTRRSKIDRQCLALVNFYESSLTKTSSVPGNLLLNAWRYYEQAGYKSLAILLRDVMCASFFRILSHDPDFFLDLTCSELESLISQDKTATCSKEITVLKVVIAWARRKSAQAGEPRIEEEVRVKPECKLEEWRGADCLVKNVNSFMQVEMQNCGGSKADVRNVVLAIQDVYDAAATGMMRLLPHVRCAFITPQELRTQLSNEEVVFASKFEGFRDIIKHVAEIAAGIPQADAAGLLKAADERDRGRKGYAAMPVSNVVEVLTSVLMHAEGPEEREKYVVECIKKRKLISPEEVEAIVARRIKKHMEKRALLLTQRLRAQIDELIDERIGEGELYSREDVSWILEEKETLSIANVDSWAKRMAKSRAKRLKQRQLRCQDVEELFDHIPRSRKAYRKYDEFMSSRTCEVKYW
jgi:hypothetical protein